MSQMHRKQSNCFLYSASTAAVYTIHVAHKHFAHASKIKQEHDGQTEKFPEQQFYVPIQHKKWKKIIKMLHYKIKPRKSCNREHGQH